MIITLDGWMEGWLPGDEDSVLFRARSPPSALPEHEKLRLCSTLAINLNYYSATNSVTLQPHHRQAN